MTLDEVVQMLVLLAVLLTLISFAACRITDFVMKKKIESLRDAELIPFKTVEVDGKETKLMFLFIKGKYRGIIEVVNKDEF